MRTAALTTDSDRQLIELDALDLPNNVHFLSVDFSRREIEFLIDLRERRDRRGDLAGLTCRQAGWLEAIHRKAMAQCRQADALAQAATRGPINMRKYFIGA